MPNGYMWHKNDLYLFNAVLHMDEATPHLHLDEINEQIADREKRYAIYEKKIDKVLAAGKPVAKELAVIRKNAKQLPSILGSEPSVKISEKDFNRLIDMAQASGTLEKLNEIYDR